MIHICYGLHDSDGRYSKFTGTSILSIFENTKSAVTIHILHDNTLTADNRDRLNRLVDRYNQKINFYNMDEICADKIELLHKKLAKHIKSRFSIGAFYRLMIFSLKDMQDIDKMIYLDSDIIVNLDIVELWNCELGDYELAAVPEMQATQNYMLKDKFLLNAGIVDENDYFCSGVVVFNLKKIDKKFLNNAVNWLAKRPQCKSPDQDILNAFFAKKYLKLPQRFDSFVSVEKALKNPMTKKIYHYAGKSFGLEDNDEYNRLFIDCFTKTPWFSAETLFNFYEGTKKVYAYGQTFSAQVTAMMSGKTRAFLVLPQYVGRVKQAFHVADEEEFIILENVDSIKQVGISLIESNGKKVFFMLIDEHFLPIRNILQQSGFIETRDFIDASLFLSDETGGEPLRSYKLIEIL